MPLNGTSCQECGLLAFPAAACCLRCMSDRVEDRELSGEGTVWAYTWQRYPPVSPPYVAPESGFTPFAVGYVQMDDQLRVLGVLDNVEGDAHGLTATLIESTPVPRFRVNLRGGSENHE